MTTTWSGINCRFREIIENFRTISSDYYLQSNSPLIIINTIVLKLHQMVCVYRPSFMTYYCEWMLHQWIIKKISKFFHLKNVYVILLSTNKFSIPFHFQISRTFLSSRIHLKIKFKKHFNFRPIFSFVFETDLY